MNKYDQEVAVIQQAMEAAKRSQREWTFLFLAQSKSFQSIYTVMIH